MHNVIAKQGEKAHKTLMPKPGDLLRRNGKFSFLEKVAYLTPVFYCGHEDIAAFGSIPKAVFMFRKASFSRIFKRGKV